MNQITNYWKRKLKASFKTDASGSSVLASRSLENTRYFLVGNQNFTYRGCPVVKIVQKNRLPGWRWVKGGIERNETKTQKIGYGIGLQSEKLIKKQSAQRWRCQSLISKSTLSTMLRLLLLVGFLHHAAQLLTRFG